MTLAGPSTRKGVVHGPGGVAARGVVVATMVIALVASGVVAPADAQAGSVRITVSEFPSVLGPGSRALVDDETAEAERPPMDLDLRVLVENEGADSLADLTLVIEVHPPADSRAELRAALEGDLPAVATSVRAVDVTDGRLLSGGVAGVSQTIGRDDVSVPGAGGVRPVRIAVIRGLEVLDETVVPVVWLSELPETPVRTTLVWPWDSPPLRTVGGSYLGGVDREIRPGGRLDVLLGALERADAPLVTFAPAPHLLEDLADRADGFTAYERQDDGALESRTVSAAAEEARMADGVLQRVRETAATLPLSPIAGSYASADLAAMFAVGGPVTELAADAAVDGRRRLQRHLGRDVQAASHLVMGPTDEGVLDLVPGESVLVPYGATAEPPLADGPSVRTPIRSMRTPAGRLVSVVLADPYLEDALRSLDHPAGPVAATARIAGETAQVYLDDPDADRALLLLPPAGWDPSPRSAALLLDALGDATWLELTSPDELLGVNGGGGIEFDAAPLGAFSPEFATALEEATVSLEAAAGALPEGETRLSGRSYSSLRDALLRASSTWLRGGGEAEAEALVRDVQRVADETFGDVEVATGPITLTSDQGQIPVTLQRSRGEAITVAVEVASQGRIVWDEGRRSEPLTLEPGASHTVSFPMRALSTGTFPVTVRVTDPSGRHELGRSSLTVRSTAISGTALSLIGLAILFLLLLGALRRPEGRRRLEAVP